MHVDVYVCFPPVLNWTKVKDNHCLGNTFGGSYSSLLDAKVACANLGAACTGVYDSECNGIDEFKLCQVGAFISSGIGSCVYTPGTTTAVPTATVVPTTNGTMAGSFERERCGVDT